MDIIDLNAERNKREQPDPDCVKRDQYGRDMFLFGLEYKMGEDAWTTHLWAYSWDDAEARVQAMRESLTIYGQIAAVIPA